MLVRVRKPLSLKHKSIFGLYCYLVVFCAGWTQTKVSNLLDAVDWHNNAFPGDGACDLFQLGRSCR